MGYREPHILPLVTGRRVLDCGLVDHGAAAPKRRAGTWLHDGIAHAAALCVGVDLEKGHLKALRATTPARLAAADVEALPFRDAFDVIVAGEIIEHLDNAGSFLAAARRALIPGGRLVITTPNATGLSPFLRALLSNRELCHPEHTAWYSPQTLSRMVMRHGFTVEALHLLPREARWKPVEFVRRVAASVRPLVAEQVVLVARKTGQQSGFPPSPDPDTIPTRP